jgi:dethiobiotin synthetase
MQAKTVAICGIDTGVGKSVATGLMAAFFAGQGSRVITQKPVQTGCAARPGDILLHRRLMGSSWNEYDEAGLTCPYCFPFAGSPHLAAELAGKRIDPEVIGRATEKLTADHDLILVEGAGGLLVPLTVDLLQLDYFAGRSYPLVLVTSPRLGSINHTLLALEAIRARNMNLLGLVYNLFGDHPLEIVRDSRRVMARALKDYGFSCPIVLLPDCNESRSTNWQQLFSTL